MQISVRTFEGRTINLEVQYTDTILNVKKQIQNKEHIRADLQRLIFSNQTLENNRLLSSYGINKDAILHLVLKSAQSTNIVAGGYGQGNGTNELCFPYGLCVDDDQTIIIADWGNHRIVQWKVNGMDGEVIAGGNGSGNQLNQLSCPTDVIVDKETNSIIISDRGNKRVVRWSRQNNTIQGEILLENIACWGLAIDGQRNLYVSDTDKHEVRRYEMAEMENGTLVAGGNGRGAGFNQLNEPSYIFVDQQKTVYVSDTKNSRIMKWIEEATEGIRVAKCFSRGLCVDSSATVFIADYGNHRVVRWSEEFEGSTVISSGNSEAEETNKVYHPWGIFADQHGQIFVSDHLNHRVQRFPLQPTAEG